MRMQWLHDRPRRQCIIPPYRKGRWLRKHAPSFGSVTSSLDGAGLGISKHDYCKPEELRVEVLFAAPNISDSVPEVFDPLRALPLVKYNDPIPLQRMRAIQKRTTWQVKERTENDRLDGLLR